MVTIEPDHSRKRWTMKRPTWSPDDLTPPTHPWLEVQKPKAAALLQSRRKVLVAKQWRFAVLLVLFTTACLLAGLAGVLARDHLLGLALGTLALWRANWGRKTWQHDRLMREQLTDAIELIGRSDVSVFENGAFLELRMTQEQEPRRFSLVMGDSTRLGPRPATLPAARVVTLGSTGD
jgi:hypothetical protein